MSIGDPPKPVEDANWTDVKFLCIDPFETETEAETKKFKVSEFVFSKARYSFFILWLC